ADLLDGVIYLDPPESPRSNVLWNRLVRRVCDAATADEAGQVFGPRVAFRIDNRNAVAPDIAVVCSKRRRIIRREFVNGPPDLAMECVAPESVERDYHWKRRLYQAVGVREYWIIDEGLRAI